MDKTKALFLDVGGVLLTNGWDHNSRLLAAKTFNLNEKEMDARHRMTFDTFEIGKLSLDDYLKRVIFYEKRSFTAEQFKDFMFSESKPFDEMLKLMSKLKAKYGLKVAVLSNEGRELNEYRIKKFKLDSFVDFFISSCYVHLRKPDSDIFRLALDVAQVPAEQVIYIDDRKMFVDVAEQLKMKGIHHVGYESTREKLEAFGFFPKGDRI